MEKVQASNLSNYIEQNYSPTSAVLIDNSEIIVKRNLSLTEMIGFVDGVVKSCFREDSNKYMPELKDFALRIGIINFYTNIELPEDSIEQYDFLTHSDIIDVVLGLIDSVQFSEMINAIDKRIEHTANANISVMEKQMYDLQHAIASVTEQFGALFEGVDMNVMNAIASSYSSGEISPEKLFAAYKASANRDDE